MAETPIKPKHMFGSNIRSVLSRHAVSGTHLSKSSLRHGLTAKLPSTKAFERPNSSCGVPANQEQRRYQSTPAAAAQRVSSSPDVNLASQFPSVFSKASSEQQQPLPEYPHHITLVKKVKKDGSPCRKCVEVLARIEREGFMHRLDRIVIADEANPMSEGMNLAQAFKVKTAPFFLVDSNADKTAPTELFTVYFKLKREILAKNLSEEQKVKDMQESPQVQELVDFI